MSDRGFIWCNEMEHLSSFLQVNLVLYLLQETMLITVLKVIYYHVLSMLHMQCLTDIYYCITKKSCVSFIYPIGLIYWSWVLWAIASEYSLCYTIQKDKPLTFQYTSLCNIKVFISSHMHKTSNKHIPLPVLCVWRALTSTNTIIN